MRILLVQPSQKNVYGNIVKPVYPPLGLLYIAAVLEKNHEIKVLDLDADQLDKGQFISLLRDYNPELVGITSTTSTIKNAFAIAKTVKLNSNAVVTLGGIHATISPEECIKSSYIDFLIKGEGELTTKELLDKINNKKNDFSKIKGLWYKKNKKVYANPDRELITNLDELPFPARHLLKDIGSYTPPDAIKTPVTTIMTSRGCPGSCTYCCTKQIFGRRFRYRDIKRVVDEIEYCINKFGIKEFHIMDDCFTLLKNRVLEFRDEIKKRKLDNINFVFSNGIRADQVDYDILKALKDINVFSLGFGVESGNQTILNNIKKGITLDKVRRAYKLSKKMSFETWGFFMIGLPGENKKTVQDTINFAKELDPDFAKFLILKPYPGSEVFDQLFKQNLIFDFNYENYGVYSKPVHRLKDLSSEEILKLQKKAYRDFYLRPSKILKHLKRIKSFTQIKLNIRSALFVLSMMGKKEFKTKW